ncbi:hypothetical protein [Falsibacillus pallidus]|uniref:Uncharacterized protein n=1 Tax=Falsibacillus pallidus TaxID=493781 RepID=A0A370G7D1_9BACI|nr:hypothetical protein [Falsibacillus pallidus]RDI37933.1 hypothetical protein DFR59_12031 [Falsibacillus pallidus]
MGHDISGYNHSGKEIAYARFSMGNYNASLLYSFLDALDYHAGASGSGGGSKFSIVQIENALKAYHQYYKKEDTKAEDEFEEWDKKQISDFLQNCLVTAKEEGSVKVLFG